MELLVNKMIQEIKMTKNIGTVDRLIRVVAGLLIIGLGLFYTSWWGAVGALLILTGTIGRSPSYTLFGIRTCKTTQK